MRLHVRLHVRLRVIAPRWLRRAKEAMARAALGADGKENLHSAGVSVTGAALAAAAAGALTPARVRAPAEGAAEVEGAPEIAAAAREFELSPGAEQRERLAEALTHARRALAAPTSILLAVLEAEAAAADADAARAAAAAIEAAAIEAAAPAAAETAAANPADGAASAPKTAPDPLPALLELTAALQTARAEREAAARALGERERENCALQLQLSYQALRTL